MAKNGDKPKRQYFTRTTADGRVIQTPIVKRKTNKKTGELETEPDFYKRMNNVGYLDLEKVPEKHWSTDQRSLHMGDDAKSCPYCNRAMKKGDTRLDKDQALEEAAATKEAEVEKSTEDTKVAEKPRKRGRPKGSKNKKKSLTIIEEPKPRVRIDAHQDVERT